MKVTLIILVILCSIQSGMAAEDGFARYQIIIDKRPFGEEPPEAETVQISLNQSFARNLRLSMLFEGPNGDLRAGIIDTSRKKNYILSIGDIQDGLELIEVDLSASEAMLRKGHEVALFKLESGAPEPLSKSQQASRQTSYAERRRALLQKIEERRQEPTAPTGPQLTGEALKKHLENVQMDAIRNGLPPLPLPLTPEMDAQLVAEGVLDQQ
ncbi:MAG: hypothetical protein JEZ10_08435 [Verrucomicrobia bacterium]|nr:hypothetical protein [Verrucomicrobiota bacterium]